MLNGKLKLNQIWLKLETKEEFSPYPKFVGKNVLNEIFFLSPDLIFLLSKKFLLIFCSQVKLETWSVLSKWQKKSFGFSFEGLLGSTGRC